MYAFCANNPIIRIDPSGEAFYTMLGAAIGGAAGALDAHLMGENVGRGALAGAASGAISGAGVDVGVAISVFTNGKGTKVGVAVSGIMGAVGSIVGKGISTKWEADGLDYVGAAMVGCVSNIISFGLAPGYKEVIATGAKYTIGGIMKAGMNDFANNVATGTIVAEFAIWLERILNWKG